MNADRSLTVAALESTAQTCAEWRRFVPVDLSSRFIFVVSRAELCGRAGSSFCAVRSSRSVGKCVASRAHLSPITLVKT